MAQSSNISTKKRTSKRNQSLLEGALILTLGTIIVKIIGACFKIPLGNIITETGNGYFNTAYSIYLPIYVLATAGFPSAIARMVSENVTLGRYHTVRKIKSTVSKVLLIAGIVGFFLMIVVGAIYVKLIKNEEAFYSIIALAPSVFFCCVMSIYRGYYEGLRNMTPTAVSQIIEALGKLFLGLGLAIGVVKYAEFSFNTSGTFLGNSYNTIEEAQYASYPFASAAAILGIALGSMIAMLYMIYRYKTVGDGITDRELRKSHQAESSKNILKNIYRIGIPIALGVLVMNITQLIDTFTITTRLGTIDEAYLRESYSGLITDDVVQGKVPMFLYGAYGFALNLFNLIPTITQSLGVSALPTLAAAWTSKNKDAVKNSIGAIMKITIFIAAPCGFGFLFLSRPILELLYPGRPGAVIAAPLLATLGIAVLFNSLLSPVNSMLQAVGKQDVPVKLMLIGASLKLVMNFTLVGIPSININGAPWGTLVCYSFIVICSLIILIKHSGVKVDYVSIIAKPLIAGLACGIAAYCGYLLTQQLIGLRLSAIAGIAFGGIAYFVVLFLIKGVTKEDVLMIPKGEKIAKTLEKFKLIG